MRKTFFEKILVIVLVALCNNQTCDPIGTPIPITSAFSGTMALSFTTNNNVAQGKWSTPGYLSGAYITVKGWNSSNGNLVELTFIGNPDEINASIPIGQSGMIRSQIITDNNQLIVNFAQKDNSHGYFYIQVTSYNFLSTIYFNLTLTQRGYNTPNGNCTQTCPQGTGIQFYVDKNGVTNLNQFICYQKNIFISIIGLIIIILLFI